MGAFDIEYHADDAIQQLLLAVDRPGDFCVHGRLFTPMPRLDIEGVGMLAFPVPEAQIRDLIDMAERAPYGKGPDTVVDTSVRDCWQIGPERIRLAGGAWPETFAIILDQAALGLGCPVEQIDAQLYKLLVYGRGGFFSTHRDTEKAPGMIATLTIALPVAGEGGELIVRHRGREVITDMNVDEASELAFAAFYADCPHEVRPVVSGHRLVLVFNLCLRAGAEALPQVAPDYGREIDAIANHLVAWSGDNGAADKIVWLLDHAYSESGLSFDSLKNADASRARALVPAADRADCELYAAILHIEEHGDAMYRDDYVDSWNAYKYDEFDMEIGELYDSEHKLDGWVAPDGSRPEFGEIELLPGELLPAGALEDEVPDEQFLHEATGNEGVSLERSWRRAAFVVWPRPRTLAILAGAGIGGAVAWVETKLDRAGGCADAEIRRLASDLVEQWPVGKWDRGDKRRSRMLDVLSSVGDRETLSRFLHEVILTDYNGDENDELLAALDCAGPEIATPFLLALIDSRLAERPVDILALVRRFTDAQLGSENPAWSGPLRDVVQSILRLVSTLPNEVDPGREIPRSDPEVPWWEVNPVAPMVRRYWQFSDTAVRDLFILARRLGLTHESDAAADAIAAVPLLVSPDRMIPAALKELRGETGFADTAAFSTLWCHAARFLLDRSAAVPKEPGHWKIDCDIDCDCELCADLSDFCRDPDAAIGRFPLRAELRRHLHQVIDRHGLDIDHVTERKGRPYTLVCTKNRESFKRRLVEYDVDIEWMQQMIDWAPSGFRAEKLAKDVSRLQDAVAKSGKA